jgi:hypothetical protein
MPEIALPNGDTLHWREAGRPDGHVSDRGDVATCGGNDTERAAAIADDLGHGSPLLGLWASATEYGLAARMRTASEDPGGTGSNAPSLDTV